MKQHRTPNLALRGRTNSRSDRGSSPVSVIILIVIVLMAAELIVMGGRIAAAHADVSNAAREGARRGSIALTAGSAVPAAEDAVANNLENKGRTCRNPEFDHSGTDFSAGGNMTVEVTCGVALADLSLLSLPWPTIKVDATAVESIETFRVVE